jgi:translation initiation factor IF-3
LKHVEEFLKAHDKVRITVVFRGRQNQHKDLGMNLLKDVQVRLSATAAVEQAPTADHNRLYMTLTPKH